MLLGADGVTAKIYATNTGSAIAGVNTPAPTALFAVATWLPWLVVASAAAPDRAVLPTVAARRPAAATSG